MAQNPNPIEKIVRDQRFFDKSIPVDDVLYVHCTFERCRMVFRGAGQAHFERCVFDNCEWVFDAAADNTLQYLAYLYTELGPGGRELVEGLFDSLRQGGAGRGVLRPDPAAAVR